MSIQEILVLIQTGIALLSLIVSLITINKVNSIQKIIQNNNSHNKKKDENNYKQVAFGSNNKQKMGN